jgi:hypothetical protein
MYLKIILDMHKHMFTCKYSLIFIIDATLKVTATAVGFVNTLWGLGNSLFKNNYKNNDVVSDDILSHYHEYDMNSNSDTDSLHREHDSGRIAGLHDRLAGGNMQNDNDADSHCARPTVNTENQFINTDKIIDTTTTNDEDHCEKDIQNGDNHLSNNINESVAANYCYDRHHGNERDNHKDNSTNQINLQPSNISLNKHYENKNMSICHNASDRDNANIDTMSKNRASYDRQYRTSSLSKVYIYSYLRIYIYMGTHLYIQLNACTYTNTYIYK